MAFLSPPWLKTCVIAFGGRASLPLRAFAGMMQTRPLGPRFEWMRYVCELSANPPACRMRNQSNIEPMHSIIYLVFANNDDIIIVYAVPLKE
jgi:hypothetical protein